jgi:hypothetical protein
MTTSGPVPNPTESTALRKSRLTGSPPLLVLPRILAAAVVFAWVATASAATIIEAVGDTITQDDNNDGIAESKFGYQGLSAGTIGVFTQRNKPSQTAFVEDRSVIRFDLALLLDQDIDHAILQLVQYGDFRGLQAGSADVYGFTDDNIVELDDHVQGVKIATLSAPGVEGVIVDIDVTAFLLSALTAFSPGADFVVFRLQNPVTSDATDNPYSLSFRSDRNEGPPPRLIAEPRTVSAPPTLLLLGPALVGLAWVRVVGYSFRRRLGLTRPAGNKKR